LARPRRSPSAKDAIEAFLPYGGARACARHAAAFHDAPYPRLFHGVPGARAFRRHIATEAVKPGAGIAVCAMR